MLTNWRRTPPGTKYPLTLAMLLLDGATLTLLVLLDNPNPAAFNYVDPAVEVRPRLVALTGFQRRFVNPHAIIFEQVHGTGPWRHADERIAARSSRHAPGLGGGAA